MNPINQQPQSKRNIFFYSNNCKFSKEFNELLGKTKISNTFLKICVDIRGIRLPVFVKRVPTIVVYDSNGHQHIFSGKEAFEWLCQLLDEPINISAYQSDEMGSTLSDNYSYIDSGKESEHNFAFLHKLNEHYIVTPDDNSNKNQKGPEVTMDQLQSQRNQDVPMVNRAPMGRNPNFKKDFDRGGLSDADIQRMQNMRTNDLRQQRAQPVPMRAPNFESGNFRSSGGFQSGVGSGYQPSGIGVGAQQQHKVGMSDYERIHATRGTNNNYQQIPSGVQRPDFQRTAHNMRPAF